MVEANNRKIISIPNKCNELAELTGTILGDGCITAYKHPYKKNMNFSLNITGHSTEDYIYLTEYISNILWKLFKVKPYIRKQKGANAIHIIVQSINLVKFLNSIDLKSGNKIRNNQGIPKWIQENDTYLKLCLRGIFDTDGSVFVCGNGTLFPRIDLRSNIPQLREDVRKSLIRFGFTPSNWDTERKVIIYRKADVFKYIKEIGFSNPKHIKRFDRFNKVSSHSLAVKDASLGN